MKASASEIGRVVISTQGHDKGQWYAVKEVADERYLLLVNGTTKPLEGPKKKQVKHVRALPLSIHVCGKGPSGGPVCNGEIAAQLKAVKRAYEQETGFSPRIDEKEESVLVQE